MKYKFNITILLAIIIIFIQCKDSPISGDKVPNEIRHQIIELGILDKDEEILVFYPPYDNKTYGNFYTKKRIASYWQYDKTPNNNYIRSAYFKDIKSIGIKFGDGFEYSSALVIELNSGKKFEVYFNGKKDEIELLYKKVTKLWGEQHK